jgi:hypothetical protein
VKRKNDSANERREVCDVRNHVTYLLDGCEQDWAAERHLEPYTEPAPTPVIEVGDTVRYPGSNRIYTIQFLAGNQACCQDESEELFVLDCQDLTLVAKGEKS